MASQSNETLKNFVDNHSTDSLTYLLTGHGDYGPSWFESQYMQRWPRSLNMEDQARDILSRIDPRNVIQIDHDFTRNGAGEVTIKAYLEPKRRPQPRIEYLRPEIRIDPAVFEMADQYIHDEYTFTGDTVSKIMIINDSIALPYNETVLNALIGGTSVERESWREDPTKPPFIRGADKPKIEITTWDQVRDREPTQEQLDAKKAERIARLEAKIERIRNEDKPSD